MGLKLKMLNPEVLLLVTCIALTSAIRVDFGTKQGPIVPPTPTTTVRPLPPFRNPAPVWEDQSDDIPNPNPYQYVLPPPSRPRPSPDTYRTSRPTSSRELVFGNVVAPNEVNTLFSPTVASLSPQYVPNFGFKYHAVVPTKAKTYYSKPANVYYTDKFSKFNGKYNAKTKKYKAYDKVKYIPDAYYSNLAALPTVSFEQQLPSLQPPKPFRLPEVPQPAVPTFNYGPSKATYSKNDLYGLSKNYKTHQPHKRHTLAFESPRTRR